MCSRPFFLLVLAPIRTVYSFFFILFVVTVLTLHSTDNGEQLNRTYFVQLITSFFCYFSINFSC